MSITDTKRFELHKTLREELGADVADTLMEHLPPSGWSDVARRQDFDELRREMLAEFKNIRSEIQIQKSDLIAHTEKRFNDQTRWIVSLMAAHIFATLSLTVSVVLKL